MISTPQKEAASNQRRRVNSAAFVYIVRRDGTDEQRQPHHCEKRSIDLRKPLLTDPRHRRLNQCDRCEQHQPLVHLGLQIRTAPPAGLVGFTASALNSIITVAARLNAMAAVARRQTFLRKTCADRGCERPSVPRSHWSGCPRSEQGGQMRSSLPLRGFLLPRPCQDAGQSMVAFVTRVLDQRLTGLSQ